MTGRFASADFAGGGEAVHFGHLAIHQDQVVALVLQSGQRGVSVAGDVAGAAAVLQEFGDIHLVDAIVLGDQDVGGQSLERFVGDRRGAPNRSGVWSRDGQCGREGVEQIAGTDRVVQDVADSELTQMGGGFVVGARAESNDRQTRVNRELLQQDILVADGQAAIGEHHRKW